MIYRFFSNCKDRYYKESKRNFSYWQMMYRFFSNCKDRYCRKAKNFR